MPRTTELPRPRPVLLRAGDGPLPSQTPAYASQDICCRPAAILVDLVGRQATVKFSPLLRCNRKRLAILSDAVPEVFDELYALFDRKLSQIGVHENVSGTILLSQHTARTELVPMLHFWAIRPEIAVQTRQQTTHIRTPCNGELDAVRSVCACRRSARYFKAAPDIVGHDVLFPLDLLKRHAAGKTPHDHYDGKSRTTDYWPAPDDGGITDDPIL